MEREETTAGLREKGCTEEVRSNKGKERKEASRITGQLKRALDFSNALVYNLLRK